MVAWVDQTPDKTFDALAKQVGAIGGLLASIGVQAADMAGGAALGGLNSTFAGLPSSASFSFSPEAASAPLGGSGGGDNIALSGGVSSAAQITPVAAAVSSPAMATQAFDVSAADLGTFQSTAFFGQEFLAQQQAADKGEYQIA